MSDFLDDLGSVDADEPSPPAEPEVQPDPEPVEVDVADESVPEEVEVVAHPDHLSLLADASADFDGSFTVSVGSFPDITLTGDDPVTVSAEYGHALVEAGVGSYVGDAA
jgi:hypothetical protein